MIFQIFLFITCICAEVFTSIDKHNIKYSDIKCDEENRSKADVCAEKLWFVGRGSRKYPENDKLMQKHCKRTSVLIKCVKDFTDQCGTHAQKELTKVMLNNIKTSDYSYCFESTKRKEFLSMSSCANTMRNASNDCMDMFLIGLGNANTVETQLKVPQACCAFNKLKSCILKSAERVGKPICGDKQVYNLKKYINSMSDKIFSTMCSTSEKNSHKCQNPSSLLKIKYKKIFKSTKFSFFWFTYYFFTHFPQST